MALNFNANFGKTTETAGSLASAETAGSMASSTVGLSNSDEGTIA